MRYACLHVAFEDQMCICRRKILIISILRLGEFEKKKTDYRYIKDRQDFPAIIGSLGARFPRPSSLKIAVSDPRGLVSTARIDSRSASEPYVKSREEER